MMTLPKTALCPIALLGLLSLRAIAAELPPCRVAPERPISPTLMEKPIGLRAAPGRVHQTVSTESDEAQRYYDQGVAYLATYVWLDAARSFEEALRRDPGLAMAELGIARAYLNAESAEMAREHLDAAMQLAAARPPSEPERKWIALLAEQIEAIYAPAPRRKARHEAYKRSLDELLAMTPEDPHAWTLRGNAEEPGAWGVGQFGGEQALRFYEKALALDADHIGALHFALHSYESLGEHPKAAAYGEILAAAAPGVPHALHMYAHVLPRLGEMEKARRLFREADRLHREYLEEDGVPPGQDWHYAHNLHLWGAVELRLGNRAEAERLFRERCSVRSYRLMGEFSCAPYLEFLLLEGRYEEAAEKAGEEGRRPSCQARLLGALIGAESRLGLGRIEEAKRSLASARRIYEEILRQVASTRYSHYFPPVLEPLFDLLEAHLALRENPEQAERRTLAPADKIAKRNNIDAWADWVYRLERMALLAKREGRAELAEKIVARIRRIDPDFPTRALE